MLNLVKTIELIKSNQIETIDLRNQVFVDSDKKPEMFALPLGNYLSNGGCLVTEVVLLKNDILACSNDQQIFCFYAHTFEHITTIETENWAHRLLALPDGLLLSAESSGKINIWDPLTGKHIKRIFNSHNAINSMVSLYNNSIAVTDGQYINIWDLNTCSFKSSILVEGNGVVTSLYSHNYELISGSSDGMICKWDISSQECIGKYSVETKVISLFVDLEDRIIAGADSKYIYILDMTHVQTRYMKIRPVEWRPKNINMLSDGSIIVGYDWDIAVILDAKDHAITNIIKDYALSFYSLSILDASTVIVGNCNGWDLGVLKFPERQMKVSEVMLLFKFIAQNNSVKKIILPSEATKDCCYGSWDLNDVVGFRSDLLIECENKQISPSDFRNFLRNNSS